VNKAPRFDARIREVIAATAVALVLLLTNIVGPLDQVVWGIQSRLHPFEPSGEIVFIGTNGEFGDYRFPERRRELAHALDRLANTKAARVYVNFTFERSSNSAADEELRSAMRRLGSRLYLVQSYETAVNGVDRLHETIPELGAGIRQVGEATYFNYLGYAWDVPFTMAEHGSTLPSLPASMAGTAGPSGETFPVNYGFRRSTIPNLDLDDVATGAVTADDLDRAVSGRILLIGNADPSGRNAVDIPGYKNVPKSLVQVYAAETLKAGLTGHIGSFPILAFCVLALCLALCRPLSRWAGVVALALTIGLPAAVIAAALFGIRIDVAPSIAFFAVYWLLRVQTNLRNRQSLVDPGSGLPTFAALEADGSVAREQPTIVVGKIHRLDDIKRTLPEELHSEYLNRVVERLRLNARDQTFYIGQGHYLAWCVPERDLRLLRDHLEGLRALLSAPLVVGGEPVDVSMTFSIDTSPSSSTAKRLASAVAAVEQTSEAHNPIAATQIESDEDLLWSISLQARIDAAMENGEIYLVYQPKVLIETGDVVGLEALVRWDDPQRGPIAPDLFIRQCESAGRMLHLTRFVMREACLAGKDFEAEGRILPIAVNISATLLHDWAIVHTLREVLAETHFAPERLTLEITETYRISSFETAGAVMAEISEIGPKISMDDFGVGAASFEALLRLPFGELKIDRLFVAEVTNNAKARGIVKSALKLGKDLRIIVVAEGVENAATLKMLKELGCVVAQGFGLFRPMRAEDILEFQKPASDGRQKA
jgi:EAL domain-containing protein (putative c-di-GMP-specific phosphodiesterase class I)/CHASE2 domain-containing sensor protein